MKYRLKQTVEAITFNDFVQYGRDNRANIVDGMPWHFIYKGHGVTHITNSCYLVCGKNGGDDVRFEQGQVLITCSDGHMYTQNVDGFLKDFEPITSFPAVNPDDRTFTVCMTAEEFEHIKHADNILCMRYKIKVEVNDKCKFAGTLMAKGASAVLAENDALTLKGSREREM